ncbi:hypothetical protein C8J56DRAFT_1042916 [Mycena floridula]|nr:hypothetical protein C8J56DRAFT_1042916 [Mycena floridula]
MHSGLRQDGKDGFDGTGDTGWKDPKPLHPGDPCDQAPSSPALLDILFASLAITKDSATEQVEQILRDIEAIPPCCSFRHHERQQRALRRPFLGREEDRTEVSRSLFTKIYPGATDDSELKEVLDVLGHMPLAITLMAKLGKTTPCSAPHLLDSFRRVRTEMLGPNQGSDSRHSVNICIRLSTENPRMRQTPEAYNLLVMVSMLPAGATLDALQNHWAKTVPNLLSAIGALRDTSRLLRHCDIHGLASHSIPCP